MLFLDSLSRRIRKRYPLLHEAISIVRKLPISYRKIVINVVQVGYCRNVDDRALLELIYRKPVFPGSRMLTATRFREIFCPEFLANKTYRSIIWNVARCCAEPIGDDESDEVIHQTFQKEFQASQVLFSDSPCFDYYSIELYNQPQLISKHWKRALGRCIPSFITKLRRLGVIFPSVQRRKNVGYDTGLQFCHAKQGGDLRNITTRDLEVLYGHTGLKIQGPCEMRTSWKFTDLKPRCYYCQGGCGYFCSRYMKKIAVALMDSLLPSSMIVRRSFDVLLEQYFYRDYVVLYDFSAFTSSLSDLRYFLYHVSRSLESAEVKLSLFDYHMGRIEVNAWELMDHYNEEANYNAAFSLARLIDKYSLEGFDTDRDYRQQNSGMLGIAGNIGFSTANHALVEIEALKGRDHAGVTLGDDGAGIMRDNPDRHFIPTMQRLGTIERQKFGIMVPGDGDPQRFVKRGLWRNEYDHHFWLAHLFALPIPNYIDGELGNRTKPPDFSAYARAKRIAVQTGQLLWNMLDSSDETLGMDIHLIACYLSEAYSYLQLPSHGAMPDTILNLDGEPTPIKFVLPSIQFDYYDPRVVDWCEYLMDNSSFEYFTIPYLAPPSHPQMMHMGDLVLQSQNPLWSAMEDLGYVKIEKEVEVIMSLNEDNKRKLRIALKRVKDSFSCPVIRVKCVRDIPNQYHSMFSAVRDIDYKELANLI